MSGIYIPGMEIPNKCIECRLMRRCGKDDLDFVCMPARIYVEDLTNAYKPRPDYCPLVPVPPHGRLIDADALHEELYGLEYARENEWLDGMREARGVDAARVTLLDAPTIIPASGGNKDE